MTRSWREEAGALPPPPARNDTPTTRSGRMPIGFGTASADGPSTASTPPGMVTTD
ncbi:hypothetical protein [Streptomyces sp. NPDC005953]|uniref:hypothetical protein n=1 Tax=Streptomyces sp. NPDC005953 TaxID=3156719 RepID=UPI0033F743FB